MDGFRRRYCKFTNTQPQLRRQVEQAERAASLKVVSRQEDLFKLLAEHSEIVLHDGAAGLLLAATYSCSIVLDDVGRGPASLSFVLKVLVMQKRPLSLDKIDNGPAVYAPIEGCCYSLLLLRSNRR